MLSNAPKLKISFIISAHNRRELVLRCLNSIFAYATQPFEVIYVDGCSTDGTVAAVIKKFPSVRVLIYDRKGVTPARNFGARFATGDLLAFIDSDAEIAEGLTEAVRSQFTKDSEVGVLGCKIISIDDRNTIVDAGGLLSPFWTYVSRKKLKATCDSSTYVYMVVGTAFIVKKSLFLKLGGFDNDFFYGGEDNDFCWRSWMAGFKVMYLPITVYHKGIAYKWGIGEKRSIITRRRYLFRSSIKNGLVSFFKNAEATTLLKFSPVQLVYFFLWSIKEGYPEAMFLALYDFFKDFKKTLHKRWMVKPHRKIRDSQIMKLVGTNYVY
jgi:GT2 family glycosyltransferase